MMVLSILPLFVGAKIEFTQAKTSWVESLFDVSEPYLYVMVLPALVLFALGFRGAALMFTFGASAFFIILVAA